VPVIVGTSGWQYRDWRGGLYPAGIPQRSWLEHYAARFPAVENNGAFYRLPRREAFAAWRGQTPAGFIMAVKASRYLTHVRRLREPAEPVRRLLQAAAGLGDRLGPVLLQLPPNFRADHELLDGCLAEFGRQAPEAGLAPGQSPVRVAVELRHESWWTEPTRSVLSRHQAALCWADRRDRPLSPLWRTADWGYLRLHEGRARPWPRYSRAALRRWVTDAAGAYPDEADFFVFCNNDQGGAAVSDAAAFAAIASGAGRTVAGPPASSGHADARRG
jgi:uncharacterized protein YecE (DUF72 family)